MPFLHFRWYRTILKEYVSFFYYGNLSYKSNAFPLFPRYFSKNDKIYYVTVECCLLPYYNGFPQNCSLKYLYLLFMKIQINT